MMAIAIPSTSKIAKKAGVSEGLIFRHFENKKGLLDAIVADAQRRLNEVFSHILFEDDPKEVIRKTIVLPFEMAKIDKVEKDFWKLQFILKWQEEYNNPHKMKPIIDKLIWAFENSEMQRLKERLPCSIKLSTRFQLAC